MQTKENDAIMDFKLKTNNSQLTHSDDEIRMYDDCYDVNKNEIK